MMHLWSGECLKQYHMKQHTDTPRYKIPVMSEEDGSGTVGCNRRLLTLAGYFPLRAELEGEISIWRYVHSIDVTLSIWDWNNK